MYLFQFVALSSEKNIEILRSFYNILSLLSVGLRFTLALKA